MLSVRPCVLVGVVMSWLVSMALAANIHDSDRLLHRSKRQTVVTRDGQTVVQAKIDCDVADLVFVLDSSGSIGIRNWYKITNFTANVINAFNIGSNNVRVGLIWYGNQADVAFYLNTYTNRREILRKIEEIPWKDQETNTSGAIRLMRTELFTAERGDRPEVPNIGVVITDGESNRDASRTIPEANLAKTDGIVMFSLGIGRQISMDELVGIANSPRDKYVFLVEDFEALANIEVEVSNAACEAAAECRENADVVFVLDGSGSVGSANFAKVKDFVKALIRDFDIDGGRMRIGLVRYSSGEQAMFNLNAYRDRDDVLKAVDAVKYTAGTTNTAGALRMLREQMFTPRRGDRPGTKNVGVVFTDGGSNDFPQTLKMAREARMAGITLLVVAVGNWVNWLEVNEVASDPDMNNAFKVDDFDRFGDIQTQLRKTICNDNNMCSPNPCKNGGRCTATIGQFMCVCPNGYAGRTCDIRCRRPVDLVLALDSSDSIGADKYNKLLDFGKELARSVSISESRTRMGVITYANDALVRFQMNRFKNPTEVVESMSFPFMTGRTNTGAALRQMRENMYLPQNGARRDVSNIAVVVTDGHSTDRSATFKQAREFRTKVGPVVVIGVGSPSKYDKMELRAIASDPDDENVMMVGSYNNLVNVTDDVVKAVCNSVDECSSFPCGRRGQCVDGINGFTCECRQGSTGNICEREDDGVLDVAILIDVSGSIRMERFPLVIDFARRLVDAMEIRPGRTRVAIGTFADDARPEFYLNTYDRKEDVLQALNYIRFRQGKTNTASGLAMLRTQLFDRNRGNRDNAPDIAIIMTDGASNVNVENTLPEAIRARDQGIYIIVVTVGASKDSLEIRGMASDPVEQNVISVGSYSLLNTMMPAVLRAYTNDENECRSNPCRNGGTCLDGVGMFSCNCRNDYAGPSCQRRCTNRKDIVFVLDASGSLGKDLEWEQRLSKTIIRGLNLNNDRMRVGLVTFQSNQKVQFYLNKYSLQQQITNAFMFARDPNIKGTNTASALEATRREMFSSSRGDRSDVANVAIVMTDGQSNIDRQGTLRHAENAKREGIRVITVGIGNEVNQAEVRGMASDPERSNTYFVSDQNQIDRIADRIIEQLCA